MSWTHTDNEGLHMATFTRKSKLAAGSLAALLAAGVGLATIPAGAQDGGPATTDSTPASSIAPRHPRRAKALEYLKAHRGEIGTALAAQLGISVGELRTAAATVRAERPADGFDSSAAHRQWRQEHLAAALQIDVATLKDAEQKAVDARIDAAVADGRISEARAQRLRDLIAERRTR